MTLDQIKIGDMVYGVNKITPVVNQGTKKYRNYLVGEVIFINKAHGWATIQCENYKTSFMLSELNPYTGTLPKKVVV